MSAATADPYGVFGHPVGHSLSPFIHGMFARETGQYMSYRLFDVAPAELTERVQQFFAEGGRGLNITLPHKVAAVELAHELTGRAAHAAAVNTLALTDKGVLGDNTDGAGLVRDIELNAGLPLHGKRVLVLGAGGAAAGALDPLLATRPAALVVANRTPSKGQALVERFAASAARLDVPLSVATLEAPGAGFDVLINATAASLQASVPPLPAGTLKAGALALDMMYGAAALPFLRWARSQGAVARDGLGMLVEQAAEAYFVWMGVRPGTFQVLTELRREVDAQVAAATAGAGT